jgi:hypothetical protein
MDERLLRILGGEMRLYPFALESKFPRILSQIMLLWGKPQIDDYFMSLMVNDREDRAGFPPDVAAEIMRLNLVHASSHKSHKKTDVWDLSTDKFASFKPPVAIERNMEWKPLPAATVAALDRLGIPCSARGFHRAAETGNRSAVALFLEAHVNTEIHNERGWTPLMVAAFKGHDEIIRVLLKHHANVHATDILGNTALHWATEAGKTSSAKLLIQNHANIDACNQTGLTPLIRAAMLRRLGEVLLLIDSGANLNSTARDGSTALHKAAAEGYIEIVRTLVHHGADMRIKNLDGSLPLTLALKNNHQEVVKLLTAKSRANDHV